MPDAFTPRQAALVNYLALALAKWAGFQGLTIPELFGLIDLAKTRIADSLRG